MLKKIYSLIKEFVYIAVALIAIIVLVGMAIYFIANGEISAIPVVILLGVCILVIAPYLSNILEEIENSNTLLSLQNKKLSEISTLLKNIYSPNTPDQNQYGTAYHNQAPNFDIYQNPPQYNRAQQNTAQENLDNFK